MWPPWPPVPAWRTARAWADIPGCVMECSFTRTAAMRTAGVIESSLQRMRQAVNRESASVSPRLSVVIDTRAPSDTVAALDRTTSIAGSIASSVLHAGDATRIETTDGRSTPLVTGRSQLDPLLEENSLLAERVLDGRPIAGHERGQHVEQLSAQDAALLADIEDLAERHAHRGRQARRDP